MTRLRFLLLILLALSSPGRADPGDAAAIMRLVAASEARMHRSAGALRTCIRPETFATALDGDRDRRRSLARMIESGRREPPLREMHDALGAPEHRWLHPAAASSRGSSDGTSLPLAEARALDEAAGAIVRGEPGPRLVARVEAAWMPGYAVCAHERAVLAVGFSAPAIRGGIAFVETGFTCGGECGNGLLYALRHGPDGWAIVAVTPTWIS